MNRPKVIEANQKEESIIGENKPNMKFNSHYIFLGIHLISYKSMYFFPQRSHQQTTLPFNMANPSGSYGLRDPPYCLRTSDVDILSSLCGFAGLAETQSVSGFMARWYMTGTHHLLPVLVGFTEPLHSCLIVMLCQ